ncbi:MAG: S1 RNA-binding domain-containing protein, partial [Gaiellaceae bacterium]
GLVHISELAQHHVENPREVVSQGDLVKAKIIEVDAERRRLSLSLKRVEGGGVTERADDSEAVEGTPNLDLSEDVFPDGAPTSAEAEEAPALEPAGEQPDGSSTPDVPAGEAEPAAPEEQLEPQDEAELAAEPEPEPAAEAEPEAAEEPAAEAPAAPEEPE